MNAEAESTKGAQITKGLKADAAGAQAKKDKKRPAEFEPKGEKGGREEKRSRDQKGDR